MHAFLYTYPAGTWKDLGNLPGTGVAVDSFAYGINDKGQIVGKGYTSTGLTRAFLYSGSTMTNLGTLPGGTYSYATGINDKGQIVGKEALTAATRMHAFLYSGGKMDGPGHPTGVDI